MTEIVVDGSLAFRFSAGWLAIDWEQELRRLARAGARKNVDIAATGLRALLIEVKDDRLKTAADRQRRKETVDSGAFLAAMAQKVRDTLAVIDDVAPAQPRAAFYARFPKQWRNGPHLFVFWWELPPEPPSGTGTRDDRWKKTLSAHTNVLKSHLHGVCRHVRIANRRFDADVVPGMMVSNMSEGIGERRSDVVRKQAGSPPTKVRKKRRR